MGRNLAVAGEIKGSLPSIIVADARWRVLIILDKNKKSV
jgi:hypothetical protein